MEFVGRSEEVERLQRLEASGTGGLVVVHGRRRVGKTRLLLEWLKGGAGLYFVADTTAPPLQRQYLAQALSRIFPGFAAVSYPDWRSLFLRLDVEAERIGWKGPLVLDEVPYLVAASPELPSVLQGWLDSSARPRRFVVAIAGSSQRMMQGIVLGRESPLYQRAREILKLEPLDPACLASVFKTRDPAVLIDLYTAWGGIPKYWELAVDHGGDVSAQLEYLVLDPLGALHDEPNTLLIEGDPSAAQVRPLLDVIGAGASRVSEIASRIGRPATALSDPLRRLQEVGLVRREVPFGLPAHTSKQSLYRIADPFCRLWFRAVSPHRATLVSGSRRARIHLLRQYWPGLAAAAWEDLSRRAIGRMGPGSALGRWGPWGPASRWWIGRGEASRDPVQAEWDMVAESLDRTHVLAGEVKWSARPFTRDEVEREAARLVRRSPPPGAGSKESQDAILVLAIPAVLGRPRLPRGVVLLTGKDVLRP